METVDLRRMHLLVTDSASRVAHRWMVAVGALGIAFSVVGVPVIKLAFVVAALVRIVGWCLPLLVPPLVACVDGLEVSRRNVPWSTVTAPSWSSLTSLRRVYLGYRLAFAWMWISKWRPVLLVGEAAWILQIARMHEAAHSTTQTAYR